MSQTIYQHNVESWWDIILEDIVLQEAELRGKDPRVCREFILYDGLARDQYEVFWCSFPVILQKWLRRLVDIPEYKDHQKRVIRWTVPNLVSLYRWIIKLNELFLSGFIMSWKGTLWSLLWKVINLSLGLKKSLRRVLEVNWWKRSWFGLRCLWWKKVCYLWHQLVWLSKLPAPWGSGLVWIRVVAECKIVQKGGKFRGRYESWKSIEEIGYLGEMVEEVDGSG